MASSDFLKPSDLDLHCFQKRINQGSAGQGFMFLHEYSYRKSLANTVNSGIFGRILFFTNSVKDILVTVTFKK